MDVQVCVPIIQYVSNTIEHNVEYYIKVVNNINQTSGLWEVINSEQLLYINSIERLIQVYALFQNSHIDVEYIKVCGSKHSLKIYTKTRRIVFSTDNDRLIPDVCDLVRQMNISNLNIILHFHN
jgi:hypothetical protein